MTKFVAVSRVVPLSVSTAAGIVPVQVFGELPVRVRQPSGLWEQLVEYFVPPSPRELAARKLVTAVGHLQQGHTEVCAMAREMGSFGVRFASNLEKLRQLYYLGGLLDISMGATEGVVELDGQIADAILATGYGEFMAICPEGRWIMPEVLKPDILEWVAAVIYGIELDTASIHQGMRLLVGKFKVSVMRLMRARAAARTVHIDLLEANAAYSVLQALRALDASKASGVHNYPEMVDARNSALAGASGLPMIELGQVRSRIRETAQGMLAAAGAGGE